MSQHPIKPVEFCIIDRNTGYPIYRTASQEKAEKAWETKGLATNLSMYILPMMPLQSETQAIAA